MEERVVVLLILFLSPWPCSSIPLCTNMKAPTKPKAPLGFCQYTGKVCCTPSQDANLRNRFQAMNISDSACASAVKSILCANCDPFAAKLFNLRPLPLLCNSNNTSFCSSVWESCQNVNILNSPFAPALQSKAGVPRNTLTDLWQSESDFCTAFGSSSSFCFNGEPVSLNKTDALPPVPPNGICLEKIGNGSYVNMVAHPDGSNRAFFSSLAGKIWLATLPDQDSGQELQVDESNPFVDLTDQVYLDTTFGMMGMAFHPNFATNGRFFASFNCDREKSPGCAGRCACNSQVDCDPSQLNSAQVCKYHTVVAEYTANGTASMANPNEVKRIFTLGLPFSANHGGQILFGPDDGYLYLMMGDGGSKGDPYNFAQNKKSLLGKIMRIDVDNVPSEEEQIGRWGNYSVPPDNPYSEDKEMEPEIWAYGLRNPWRCSFDAERGYYFLCADIGQDQYEEVDVIYKGGNYGWRLFEGPIPFQPGGNTSAASIDPIFPVVGYSHSEINPLGSAAISGGYFYRAQTDPCTYGSYLYADLYANHIWAASETPKDSGNFTSKDTSFSCAPDSPINCNMVPKINLPALQLIFSFGQDNRRDVYILAQSGVYRVVRPSRCNYSCSKEVRSPRAPAPSTSPSPSPSPSPQYLLMVSVFAFLVLELFFAK